MPANKNLSPESALLDLATRWTDLRSYIADLDAGTRDLIEVHEKDRHGAENYCVTDVLGGQLQMLAAIASYMDNSQVTRG